MDRTGGYDVPEDIDLGDPPEMNLSPDGVAWSPNYRRENLLKKVRNRSLPALGEHGIGMIPSFNPEISFDVESMMGEDEETVDNVLAESNLPGPSTETIPPP